MSASGSEAVAKHCVLVGGNRCFAVETAVEFNEPCERNSMTFASDAELGSLAAAAF